jgi:hypothetical protein
MSQHANKYCRFEKDEGDPRERVVFVEAQYDGRPGGIPPSIIDKRKGKFKYYDLNATQAFILRFTLQDVPIDLLTQLYMSEFGVNDQTARGDIEQFIDTLLQRKLIKTIPKVAKPHVSPYVDPNVGLPARDFEKPLELDFSVDMNQTGTVQVKIPPR